MSDKKHNNELLVRILINGVPVIDDYVVTRDWDFDSIDTDIDKNVLEPIRHALKEALI